MAQFPCWKCDNKEQCSSKEILVTDEELKNSTSNGLTVKDSNMEVDPYSEEIKENEPKSSSSEESSSLKTDDLDSEKYKDGTEERKKKKRKRKKYLKREPTEEELRKFVKIKVNYVAKNHI